MFDDRKARCRVCNQRYVEDLTTIDTLATGNSYKYHILHNKFMVDGKCCCPLCSALCRSLINRENGL